METSQKLPKDKEDGRVQFCKKDWQLLLDWCEIEGNLDAVKGTDKTTRIGTKYPTKRQAFDDLGKYINEHQFKGSTLVKLSWETARNWYNYLGGLYKKAKEAINGTGWGLTEKDEAKGIHTLDEKIEKLCPCYERVHSIFGGTPRTDLRGNTLVSSLGKQLDEQVPWAEHEPACVVVVDIADDNSEDTVNEGERIQPEKSVDNPLMEESGSQPVPPTPTWTSQTPLPTPHSPALFPAQEDRSAETTPDASVVSGTPAKATKAALVKLKSNKVGSFSNKRKHGGDKGQSMTSAFSSGMDSIGLEKAKSNEIKEKAYELRFKSLEADRALRSEIGQKKLAIEVERLQIEKQKVANELHATRLEATMKIVNENKHRPPTDLAAILAAFTASLPPMN